MSRTGSPRSSAPLFLDHARDRLGSSFVAFFGIVVIAAGASAIALLVAPGSTDRYFSWTLRPPAAASLVGGLYLASAVVFAWGLTLPRRQARALLTGVLGLALPTLVLTFVHDEVFDFSRWQAVAWVALFVTAPVTASALLLRSAAEGAASPPLAGWIRAALTVLAVGLMTLGVLIWIDSTRQELLPYSPVELVRLTGTYLGAWCSFLGTLCGLAAVRGLWDEGRVALFALAAASTGVTVGLLRSFGDVRHPIAAVLTSAVLTALALAALAAEPPSERQTAGPTT